MTGFDFALIAILLVSSLLGLWRGLVYEVLSLAGWPVAFLLSRLFAADVAPLVPASRETMRIMLAYAAVFVSALVVWGVLVWLLSKLVKAVGLGWLDGALGGLFGVARGALAILALVWLAGLTHIPEQPFWRDAKTSGVVEDAALMTKAWLPDNFAQRIRYGTRN
ncbi:MAG: CvpA family protein [Nitrosomonadales bacterium]|nr:CvpA family protein [Nitrosomonadales bacterium]